MEGRLFKQFRTDYGSVREFAYLQDRNYPTRNTMEDNHFALDGICKEATTGLFSVLDGHGGSEVSDSCVTMIPNIFQKFYPKGKDNIFELLKNVFVKVDEQLKLVGASDQGSTCCLVLLRQLQNKRVCTVANLGDTRAVLAFNNGSSKRVSVDHKACNPSEEERIKYRVIDLESGVILKGRVAGQLAITRAFGDLQLKKHGVSCLPDIEQFEILPTYQYLIVASDGLWDVCSDEKAVELTIGAKSTDQMCKILIDYALKNGSKDNISVLILKFN